MSPEGFLVWIEKQLEKADEVHSCYEAGCFGHVLHRKLTALGVRNLVVRLRSWDEYGQRVKTDKRDAAEDTDFARFPEVNWVNPILES